MDKYMGNVNILEKRMIKYEVSVKQTAKFIMMLHGSSAPCQHHRITVTVFCGTVDTCCIFCSGYLGITYTSREKSKKKKKASL